MDENEQLHKVVVDMAAAGLDHKHVLVADVDLDLDARLVVGKLAQFDLSRCGVRNVG